MRSRWRSGDRGNRTRIQVLKSVLFAVPTPTADRPRFGFESAWPQGRTVRRMPLGPCADFLFAGASPESVLLHPAARRSLTDSGPRPGCKRCRGVLSGVPFSVLREIHARNPGIRLPSFRSEMPSASVPTRMSWSTWVRSFSPRGGSVHNGNLTTVLSVEDGRAHRRDTV
jgi:hypothetical protein